MAIYKPCMNTNRTKNDMINTFRIVKYCLVWLRYNKLSLNFSFWNSATTKRTSMGLGSQKGFVADLIHAPPLFFDY